MKKCVCGEWALYFCKLCHAVFCKEHKEDHVKSQSEHILEKLGQKLRDNELAKIVVNL